MALAVKKEQAFVITRGVFHFYQLPVISVSSEQFITKLSSQYKVALVEEKREKTWFYFTNMNKPNKPVQVWAKRNAITNQGKLLLNNFEKMALSCASSSCDSLRLDTVPQICKYSKIFCSTHHKFTKIRIDSCNDFCLF